MKSKLKPAMFVLALTLGICLLFPSAALAQGTNCPHEPASGTPIADGQIYIGTNCTLTSPGDVDGFVFSGNNGDIYHLVTAINGPAPTNICLTLYDPNGHNVFSGCTRVGQGGGPAVVVNQALTVTGTYTIDISEVSIATISYALSLERLYPFPPNAQQINLSTQYPGDITPITDSNAFTFGGATTGTYQVSATLTGNYNSNVCMDVYFQDGTQVGTEQCTRVGQGGGPTINLDLTPAQSGTFMAFFQVAGNDGIQTYTMEVSCIVGDCPGYPIPDVAGYAIFQGAPLVHGGVTLGQPGTPLLQFTTTDSNGYYQFLHIIPGRSYRLLINGQGDLGTPASGDAASADKVGEDPLK